MAGQTKSTSPSALAEDKRRAARLRCWKGTHGGLTYLLGKLVAGFLSFLLGPAMAGAIFGFFLGFMAGLENPDKALWGWKSGRDSQSRI